MLFFNHRIDPKFNGAQCTLANPHSNAAVDLNGDCLAGESLVSAREPYSSRNRFVFSLR